MTWFSKWFGRREAPVSEKMVAYTLLDPGAGIEAAPGRSMTEAAQTYTRHETVFGAIRMIATAVAAIPFVAYRTRGGARVEVETSAVLDLLNRPNPWEDRLALFESLVVNYFATGNGYLYAPGTSRATELYSLPAQSVTIRPGGERIAAYVLKGNGREQILDPDRVLHMKVYDPTESLYGTSPLYSAAEAVDASLEAARWNRRLLINAGRPSGALTVETSLTPDQRTDLRRSLERIVTGTANAGRPILLEQGIKWQQLGATPADLEWLDGIKLNDRKICRALGIAPELLGDGESKTYSNYTEARLAFYEETVLPLADKIVSALNGWLCPMIDASITLGYDRDAIPALAAQRETLWRQAAAADFLSVNEKRALLGYGAIPGGDVVLTSAANVPLDEVTPKPAKSEAVKEVERMPRPKRPTRTKEADVEAARARAIDGLDRLAHGYSTKVSGVITDVG